MSNFLVRLDIRVSLFPRCPAQFLYSALRARLQNVVLELQRATKSIEPATFDSSRYQQTPHTMFENFHQTYRNQEDAPFEYIKLLGRGSGGTVDEVRHRTTKDIYARKCINLPPQAKSTSKQEWRAAKMKKIEEEARIIRRLRNNPHIVEVVGTYETTDGYRPLFCIILLPLAERDLGDMITHVAQLQEGEEKNDAIRTMRHWGACLVRATNYMHERRVKHKDIKPGNILVRGEEIWITDFGIAKEFLDQNSESVATHVEGTLTYCPPEALNNKRRGRASDMFSLGCCFLEMATVMITDGKLEDLKQLRKGKPYAESEQVILRWIFYLFSVLAARNLRIAQTTGFQDSMSSTSSDAIVVRHAVLLPAFAFVMMDPNSAQRITARQLVILISVFQEDMYCAKCKVGVPKEDPMHGLHSKFKSRKESPELEYPPNPEDVLKPGFPVPVDWEAAKRDWLKEHIVLSLFRPTCSLFPFSPKPIEGTVHNADSNFRDTLPPKCGRSTSKFYFSRLAGSIRVEKALLVLAVLQETIKIGQAIHQKIGRTHSSVRELIERIAVLQNRAPSSSCVSLHPAAHYCPFQSQIDASKSVNVRPEFVFGCSKRILIFPAASCKKNPTLSSPHLLLRVGGIRLAFSSLRCCLSSQTGNTIHN
ncbi:kinase-like protein [Lindgomyces ingoldianus]|uniref:Kinase-like protein n=1 Tax=Lindgomyces ingoldianus TaxID=673940 RepID=A0ACB6QC03_9PLEO|nr:kinase-like protein [Lindgomyces ingoldianus]KAF2464385.1 kinase-like protein [Lindgomyces ingoldianus]